MAEMHPGEDSGAGREVVNLAVAMQKAVLAIRRSEEGVRAPYHWAGFIFNGAWLFPRLSLKDQNSQDAASIEEKLQKARI